MLPGESGISVSVGVSGSGKSYGQRAQIFAAAQVHPVIAIDRMREWTSVPASLARVTAHKSFKGGPITTIAEAAKFVAKGARLVIVRANAAIPAEDIANEACKWACEYPGIAGLVIPEAHNAMPNKGNAQLPEYISEVATAWRHHKVAMYADTQRFALLNVTVRDLSRVMRLYGMTGKADLSACDEISTSIRPMVLECARRLAPVADGGLNEPGWHVRLGLVRVPPFKLTREL